MAAEIIKPKYISMKGHSDFNERWLHEQLIEDPSLLGLGDLDVRDSERSQPSGGRLDLLLVDLVSGKRYEVELQLGSIDESHLIRTIEYWDIERTRYPDHEHVAVIVAENVTGRFLNVIHILQGAVPLIAIQLQLVKVGEMHTVVASRIVDFMARGTEDEDAGRDTDRDWWRRKSSDESMGVADDLFKRIQEIVPGAEPKYNQQYIGVTIGGKVRNVVSITPRKKGMVLANFKIPQSQAMDDWFSDIELSTLPPLSDLERYRVHIRALDLKNKSKEIDELIQRAHLGTAETGRQISEPIENTESLGHDS